MDFSHATRSLEVMQKIVACIGTEAYDVMVGSLPTSPGLPMMGPGWRLRP